MLAPTWIEFDGAAQVAQLRRTVTKNGKKTVEVACLITSDRDALTTALAVAMTDAFLARNLVRSLAVLNLI